MSDATGRSVTTGSALARIWDRLAEPFDTFETVDAILGLPPKVMRQLAGTLTATSPEARTLLSQMPSTLRSLATSMQTHAERCQGEIRGPVLWSETMSARASSNGVEDLFVCATPGRAYDIDENRVLVAALQSVLGAVSDSRSISEDVYDDASLRTARRVGEQTRRFMLHPSLRGVTIERPSGRSIRRTRSGKNRRSYQPAIEMLRRADNPLDATMLEGFVDQRTRAQHEVLMSLVDRMEDTGSRLPAFRAENGALYAGPLQYHHPRLRGDRSRLSGIVLGSLLIDVPERVRETNRDRAEEDLAARARGRTTFVVMDRADIERAFSAAVGLARS